MTRDQIRAAKTYAHEVFCPTCLAKPGRPCRSLVRAHQNPEAGCGVVCPPHPARKAKASGLKVLKDEEKP